jgi:hypothetical protein
MFAAVVRRRPLIDASPLVSNSLMFADKVPECVGLRLVKRSILIVGL